MTLFEHQAQQQMDRDAPLAARMRPRTFDEFVGQEHIIGPGRALRKGIEADRIPSMVLWGPPGSGKTTLAHIIASTTSSHFSPVSAVGSGVADLRRIVVPLVSKETPPRIRLYALSALGRKEFRWTVDLLVDVLEQTVVGNEPNARDVFEEAAGALAANGDPRAILPMIAVIEADNTRDTIYGIGHFGLRKLTGVQYDEKHNGAWWRAWWEKNKGRFPAVSDTPIPVLRKGPAKEVSYRAPSDVADVPSQDLRAGGDPKKRYFLIGEADKEGAPEDGYKLLFVLPGGDGSADFHPFVQRIYKNVLSEDWLIAEPVAPEWDKRQFERITWPTAKSRYPAAKFTTEAFIAAILKDVRSKVKLDSRAIFMLGWSSGGPPVYATTLTKKSPIVGAFVAMSIFVPSKMPKLEGGKDKAFYLLQSPDDQVTKILFAERAEKSLQAAGAKVKLERYPGGHGWQGNVFGMLRDGIGWLEQNAAAVN
ncbi:MAG: AAA family ATPase [Planctomycetes bacterium]|nr:AAA family ATPase [Planctomycetota bacterium]